MWFLILFMLSISPRLVLFILALTTHYAKAFTSGLWPWPILGFVFMPWTTLWCAYVYNHGGLDGTWRTVVLVFCVLSDLGSNSNAGSQTRG